MTQHGDAHLFSSTWYVSWIIAPRCPAFWPPGGKRYRLPRRAAFCLVATSLYCLSKKKQLYIHRLFSHSAPTSRFSRSTRLTRDNCLCKLNQLEIFFFPHQFKWPIGWLGRYGEKKKDGAFNSRKWQEYHQIRRSRGIVLLLDCRVTFPPCIEMVFPLATPNISPFYAALWYKLLFFSLNKFYFDIFHWLVKNGPSPAKDISPKCFHIFFFFFTSHRAPPPSSKTTTM